MIRRIATETDINVHDFKVTMGTMDKKDPQVIYIECGTYVTPADEKKSYTDDVCNIKKEYRDIIKRMVSNNELFDDNYISTIEIPLDRISPKRKTYITFQYTLKQKELKSFTELTKEHYSFIEKILEEFKGVLLNHNYIISKGKK